MRSAPPPEPPTWFGASALPPPSAPAPPRRISMPAQADTLGFARLWTAFMSARVLVALAVFGLHVGVHLLTRSIPPWILGLCICHEDGRIVEGNEFFVSFRRAHGGQSTWQLEDLAVS